MGETAPAHVDALTEARGLIRGPRQRHYGLPTVNLARIASAWEAYGIRVQNSRGELRAPTNHDVCQAMILLKTVRQADGYHRDSTVDQPGYAALAELCAEPAALVQFLRDVGASEDVIAGALQCTRAVSS